MASKKIQFEDKIALESLTHVDPVNKFTDQDANEIKEAINTNADVLDQALVDIEDNRNYIGELKEYTDKRIDEIAITGVDLSNYYDKEQTDALLTPVATMLTNHENALNNIQQDQIGQDQKIANLENNRNDVTQLITDLEAKVDRNQTTNEGYFKQLNDDFTQSQNTQDQKIDDLEAEDITIKQSLSQLNDKVDLNQTTNEGYFRQLNDTFTQSQHDQDQKIADLTNTGSDLNQSLTDLEAKVDRNQTTNEGYFKQLNDDFTQSQNTQDQKIDNLEAEDTNIKQSVNGLNQIIQQLITDLKNFRPFKYVGVYTPGTIYQLNEVVSLGDALYLSNTNNNSDTPPSPNWVLLNDQVHIDLRNYYTKPEIDQKVTDLSQRIQTNENDINQLETSQNQQDVKIGDLENSVQQLETSQNQQDQTIADLNNKVNNKQDQIQDLNQYAKLNQNQTWTGTQRFNQPLSVWRYDNGVRLVQDTRASFFTVERSDGTRRFMMGNPSSNSDVGSVWSLEALTLNCDQGDLSLHAKQGNTNNNNKRIINVANPVSNQDVATKQYVDGRVGVQLTAGDGISISNNRINNVLWNKRLAVEEKLTLVFEAQDRISANNTSTRTWHWNPETHQAGYLFVFILKNRDQRKPDTGIQFRQVFWNNLSYYNIVHMPINDGSDTGTNAIVLQEDYLTFQIHGGEIRQLKGNWSIYLGTLHIRVYKITNEVVLR